MLRAFPVDNWCESPGKGLFRRKASPAYVVEGNEPVVVLSFTRARQEESNQLQVETRDLTDDVLDSMLVQLVTQFLEASPEHQVSIDQLAEFLNKNGKAFVFLNPQTPWPLMGSTDWNGTVVTSQFLPAYQGAGDLPIYVSTKDVGMVVQVKNPSTNQIERGAVLRPSQFMRVRVVAEMPSALDFILNDD